MLTSPKAKSGFAINALTAIENSRLRHAMSLELPCPSCGRIRIYSTLAGKLRAVRSKTVCKICAGSLVPEIRPEAEAVPVVGDPAYVPLQRFFDLLADQRKKK